MLGCWLNINFDPVPSDDMNTQFPWLERIRRIAMTSSSYGNLNHGCVLRMLWAGHMFWMVLNPHIISGPLWAKHCTSCEMVAWCCLIATQDWGFEIHAWSNTARRHLWKTCVFREACVKKHTFHESSHADSKTSNLATSRNSSFWSLCVRAHCAFRRCQL